MHGATDGDACLDLMLGGRDPGLGVVQQLSGDWPLLDTFNSLKTSLVVFFTGL